MNNFFKIAFAEISHVMEISSTMNAEKLGTRFHYFLPYTKSTESRLEKI